MAFSEEQMQMFFDEWQQQAMPKLPDIPGWHVCWLSTTNIYDSVDKRIRMGYQAVKPEEVPGYEHMRVKSGEFAGLISINELVMFKIPMPLYQKVMAHFHHDEPRNALKALRSDIEARMAQSVDSDGNKLGIIEGDDVSKSANWGRAPTFQ